MSGQDMAGAVTEFAETHLGMQVYPWQRQVIRWAFRSDGRQPLVMDGRYAGTASRSLWAATVDPVSVHSYLVTAEFGERMDTWALTAAYANWIEGRERDGRETWLVTCFDENSEAFLAAAKAAGVTVEEIEDAGDGETYKLLAGEPGSGWQR